MDPFLKDLYRNSKKREDILDGVKPKYISKEQREKIALQEAAAVELGQNNTNVTNAIHIEEAEPAPELSVGERQVIKERYLGEREKQVKKLKRFGDKRNLFEWDEQDDTSKGADLELIPFAINSNSSGSNIRILPSRNVIRTVDAFGNEVEVMAGVEGKGRHLKFDDRHWKEKSLQAMAERDWRILKEDFSIATSGGAVPNPIRFWDEAPFPASLKEIISESGYKEPTAIQRQAIPIVLCGRDLIGIAETGSGKTAAFILPIICQILRLPPLNEQNMLDGPYGLVLAPTRELATQIEEEAKKFCRPLGLRCVSIIGGHSMAEQSVHMRKGVEIVIATPGRLRDCLEQRLLALNQCYTLVMDEADRMIDLNFEEDLHAILHYLPLNLTKPDSVAALDPEKYLGRGRYRQTTMFSATMPPAVEKLAREYLRRPAVVTVGQVGRAAETVEQQLEMIKDSDKDRRLLEILNNNNFNPPIIIFVNQKVTVDFLSRRLEAAGHRSIALHGGKNQEQREAAIAQLRRKNRDILIATDVAGRGLDIKDVSLVINYDMAKNIEDYIHRIGRTGRMGKLGTAITFLTGEDSEVFWDLRAVVQKAPKAIVPDEFLHHEATRTKPGSVGVQKRRNEERIFAYGV